MAVSIPAPPDATRVGPDWVRMQVRDGSHLAAVAGFGVAVSLGITAPVLLFVLLLVFAFVMACVAIARNWPLFLAALLIGLIPVVGWLLALFFLIRRWRYLRDHKDAVWVAAGVFVGPWCLLPLGFLPGGAWIGGAIAAGCLHASLRALYARGYSARASVEIIGTVPMLVVMLVLPLIHFAHAHADGAHADVHTTAGSSDAAAVHGVPTAGGINTHLVGVHDYVVDHTGVPQHVDAYIRTAPDHSLSNNLSTLGVHLPTDAGPSWFPDPWHAAPWRWWDGSNWTGHVAGGAPA